MTVDIKTRYQQWLLDGINAKNGHGEDLSRFPTVLVSPCSWQDREQINRLNRPKTPSLAR